MESPTASPNKSREIVEKFVRQRIKSVTTTPQRKELTKQNNVSPTTPGTLLFPTTGGEEVVNEEHDGCPFCRACFLGFHQTRTSKSSTIPSSSTSSSTAITEPTPKKTTIIERHENCPLCSVCLRDALKRIQQKAGTGNGNGTNVTMNVEDEEMMVPFTGKQPTHSQPSLASTPAHYL